MDIMRNHELRTHEQMILLSLECELQLYNDNIKNYKQKLKDVQKYFEKNNCITDLNYIYSYLSAYYFEKKMYKDAAKYFNKKENIENE